MSNAAKSSMAEEATQLIYWDREGIYGDPGKNLREIAVLWSAYLETPLTPEDVCNLMILMKTARLKISPRHRDSMVDIIGYTLLKERIQK